MKRKLSVFMTALGIAMAQDAWAGDLPCDPDGHFVEEWLNRIRPSFNAVTQPHLFLSFTNGRVLGGYQTRSGLLIKDRCFLGKTAAERLAEEKKFEATLEKMLRDASRCGVRRMMGSPLQLLYQALDRRPQVDCDPNGCVSEAAACADVPENRVTFKGVGLPDSKGQSQLDYRFNSSIWFHEFLHLGRVDNQRTEVHNNIKAHESDDEVYFWDHTCFDPSQILARVRKDPESCRKPFESKDSQIGRYSYNPREIESACLFYDHYLAQEKRLAETIESQLVPAVVVCDRQQIGRACPAFDVLRARSPELARWIPPSNLSLEGVLRWRKINCAHADDRVQVAAQLSACGSTLARGLLKDGEGQWSEEVDAVIQKGLLNESEAEALSLYWQLFANKARFLNEGPGAFLDFPEKAQAPEWLRTHVLSSSAVCEVPFQPNRKLYQGNGLKGTSFCLQYTTFAQDLELKLLREWGL